MSVEDFLSDVWERRPLHRKRHDARYYDSVLTRRQIQMLLDGGDLRHPALQLAKDGVYYAAEAFTRSMKHGTEVFAGVPDMDKVRAEYRSGATIVLPAMQRLWPPLRNLCDTVEEELSHAVHANAYLTPGRSAGFSPHYDTHDIFVMQIAGRKSWRIHEPPVSLPHSTQPFAPGGHIARAPTQVVDLEPGDLLYLPRGYVHAAATSEGASAHITLGVTVFTWVELAAEILQASKDVRGFREALPAGFARRVELKGALREGLFERLDALRGQLDSSALVDAFLQRVGSMRPRRSRPLDLDVNVIGLHTELRVIDPARYTVGAEGANTSLVVDGRKLRLPAGVRTTLEALCARGTFRTVDLPGDLDETARLAFVRFLEGEGLLAQVSSRESAAAPRSRGA